MTANHQMNRQYTTDFDLLFMKCQEAIKLCAFELQESDSSSGYIKAKTKMSWKSFGENIELRINHNGAINITSTSSVPTTLYDYGKNKENIESLFRTLDTLIGSVALNISKLPTPSQKQIQLIQDTKLRERIEIISVEDIPLDNRFGSNELSVEHEFLKTVSNEVTLENSQEIGGTGSLDLFNLVKAEISRTSSQKYGLSMGETVTRRFNLTFSVKSGDFVVYKVIWKRRVIDGEYHIMFNQNHLVVPYSLQSGLEYEVSTGQGHQV
jgi:hypothetical protein